MEPDLVHFLTISEVEAERSERRAHAHAGAVAEARWKSDSESAALPASTNAASPHDSPIQRIASALPTA